MPAATHDLRQALGLDDSGEPRLVRVGLAARSLLSREASPAHARQIDLELCACLNLCMQQGDFYAACGLVRAVLNSPPEIVDHARMMTLLTARAPRALPAALQALSRRLSDRPNQVWVVYSQVRAQYVHRLATFDEDERLQDGERLAPTRPDLPLEPPMLHRLCGGLGPDGDGPRPPRIAEMCNAILLYLSDVLGRYCQLVDKPGGGAICNFPDQADVAGIFAARHAVDGIETTAAQLALRHGQPAVAAIMILAIQESAATPYFKQHLLEQLNVNVDHVLRSLRDTEVKTQWIDTLISRLTIQQIADIERTRR